MSREDGMECRACGCRQSYVQNTYKTTITWRGRTRTHIRRRRVCRHCGVSFHTVEVPEDGDRIGIPEPDENTPETPPETDNPFLPD